MTKRILITAGPVYGKLDDNKIVSNRSRGIWAVEFAIHLDCSGHDVTLLVPDIMEKQFEERLGEHHDERNGVRVLPQTGFENYSDICHALAPKMDAAIMAAAVVNWIPESPFPGKMPTDKKRIEIPFILAPRVISEMKTLNPKLTLIGCKLLFSNELEKLTEAAYHVVLAAKCNAVVANDALIGLRSKYVIHQDRSVTSFHDDFDGLYEHLEAIINDEHYHTDSHGLGLNIKEPGSCKVFDAIVDKYRDQFTHRVESEDFVFGSVAVRHLSSSGSTRMRHREMGGGEGPPEYLVSPREKGEMFSSDDALLVHVISETKTVRSCGGKATLNAPLLIRHLEKYPEAAGVVHLHGIPRPESEPDGAPIASYAPPGTVRDNDREIPGLHYYIEGHGWILALDSKGEVIVPK